MQIVRHRNIDGRTVETGEEHPLPIGLTPDAQTGLLQHREVA